MSYATVADVQALIPGRPIDQSSSPSYAQVALWIAEGEAMLNNTLSGAGLPAPYIDTDSKMILRVWVTEFIQGRVRMAHASAGGDGTNDDGKDLVANFFGRLKDITKNAATYDSMLSAGAPGESSARVRGSNADGDLEAEFTRDMVM